MKFSMGETMKHRVIGITVIISIAAIFVPAILKKNSQRIDDHEISIYLPPKPPQIAMDRVDEEQEFKSVKVAHIELPTVDSQRSDEAYKQALSIGKPEILHSNQPAVVIEDKPSVTPNSADKPPAIASQSLPKASKKIRDSQKHKTVKPKSSFTVLHDAKPSSKTIKTTARPHYVVQLGAFSQEKNAEKLLILLKNKGIDGKQSTIHKKSGAIYKITAGNSTSKVRMQKLQNVILSQLNVKGIVVQDRG